jgi:hypothetical protein
MTDVTGRCIRLASPTTALVLGGLVLALIIADVPLAGLARQGLNASGGSLPVWISAPFAVVGFVLAWRKPGNPLGWIILGTAVLIALSEDASYYTVADYRLRHGGLPLGWVALLAQPGWAPGIVLFGLTVLLFPDGRPPSPRLRWVVWVYAATGVLWIASAAAITVGAVIGHHTQVDSAGNLLVLGYGIQATFWWKLLSKVFLVLGVAGWLMCGSAVALIAIVAGSTGLAGTVGGVFVLGFIALPLSIGVAVLRYGLFEIDRIISRTLAYTIVTGLLVGVYAGIVLLSTDVLSLTSSAAVAASTLAAAALFNPLRRRVQRVVDRRFNRARYDGEQTVAAFAVRLKDAVDLDSVRDDLASVVQEALEAAHVSVWMNERE